MSALDGLLASDRLTPPTRRALQARIAWRAGPTTALTERQRETLRAIAARLVPVAEADDLGGRLEAQLATGPGDGWRYAEMPGDVAAMRAALDALDGFAALSAAEQDATLARVQVGEVEGWPVDPRRWFEDTLAACAELAYAQPALQLAIGYDGMADAHGQPTGPISGP